MSLNNTAVAPNVDHEYEITIVRFFTIMAVFWGIVGMTVGVFIASQLAWPALNFDTSWLSFGRLRPLHTNAVIFAFGGSALFATSYYIVQRTCKTRLFAPYLAWFTFWGWQAVIVAAVITLPLGLTSTKEYAELEWPIDIAIEKQRQINELGYSTTELMSVVAVNEGNDWYISPLMTGADFGFRSTSGAASWGDNEIMLGHSIPEATQFSSSEEAATGLANAIANGTPRELAKVMPLPERRLLAVYGPTLTNNIERESLWEEDLLVNPPQNPEFTSSTDDGITLVSPTHVTLDYSHYWGGSASVTIDNTCIRIKEDSDQYQSCLENGPDDFGPPLNILSQLGLSFSAVAVEENGGWLMSPLQTIYYQGNTLLGNLITLNNEGRLDELGY